MNPAKASQDFVGRMIRSAANAEKRRVQIQFAKRFRPAFLFAATEGALGLATLCSAASRKSWLQYSMGATLLAVACGHAFLDIRERKILDLLSDKLP